MSSHTSILKEVRSFVFAAVQVPKLESRKEKNPLYLHTGLGIVWSAQNSRPFRRLDVVHLTRSKAAG